MRYAVISDVHANRQAWQAVLDDIALQSTDAILCIGDVVGYGPMPAVTLDSVCKYADVMVLGNHDAVIGNRINVEIFNDDACRIIEWTRERLNDDATRLFAKMPLELEVEDFLIVHAEVADPERFYYIEEAESARESFDACEHALIFVGHTHNPAVFVFDQETSEIFLADTEIFTVQEGMRYIVNVGSVGDPRCADIRACYCVYDSDTKQVTYRRVPFDIEGYHADLEKSGLTIKPYFLLSILEEKQEDAPIQDWIVHTSLRPARKVAEPVMDFDIAGKQVIRTAKEVAKETRRRREEEEQQAEEARAWMRRQRKEQLRKAIAAKAMIDLERKKKKEEEEAEIKRKLQLARQAAENARKLKEEQEAAEAKAKAEKIKLKKKQLQETIAAKTKAMIDLERKKKEEEAEIRRKLQVAHQAAEKARKLKEEQDAAEAKAKAEKLNLKKKQLQETIVAKTKAQQERKKKKEEEKAAIRKKLQILKQKAAKTKQTDSTNG